MATTEMSATTVYWEKVEVPIKCSSSLPLHLNRDVPSGMTPFPCVALILPQRFVLPDLQNLHSPHSGVLERKNSNVSVSPFERRWSWNSILESHNIIPRFHVSDAFANRLYDTSALMTEDYGECSLWVLSGKRVSVCLVSASLLLPMAYGRRPVWQTPV